MPYLSYEQISVSPDHVRDVNQLTVPGNATWVELQAVDNHIRYTMDDSTDPTAGSGMLLLTTSDPKLFLIEDIRRIKFISEAAGADAELNIHYGAGRDV